MYLYMLTQLKKKSLLIYFEREREQMQGKGVGGRIPSRLHAVSAEPDVGLLLRNHEVLT